MAKNEKGLRSQIKSVDPLSPEIPDHSRYVGKS